MIMFDSIAHMNFDVPETIVYGTKEGAENILSELENYLACYGPVPVAYLCELLDKPTCSSMEYYGWKDLRGARIYQYRNGYALKLPEPVQLSNRIPSSYDRRPDCFPYYKKSEKPIGTVDEKTISISDRGFSFTATVDPGELKKLYVIFMGYYPEKIVHNGPATIVFWPDRTKTVVKCSENDIYDPFDAFTAALAKKIYGTTSSVKTMLKKVTVEQKPKKKE